MESEIKSKNRKKNIAGFLTLQNFRDVFILLVLVLFFWKLIEAHFTIDLSDFKFSDFLSLTMALFAISLSVAFFFKATDTSNKFYDNVYKFTKEVSEILGRIEAGFGERLKHIDEGYMDINRKVANINTAREKTERKVDEEERDVEKVLEEREKIITELLEKTTLGAEEKQKFKQEIEEKDKELDYSRKELMKYRSRLNMLEKHLDKINSTERNSINNVEINNELMHAFKEVREIIGLSNIIEAPQSYLTKRFRSRMKAIHPETRHILIKYGILDDEFSITDEGIDILRNFARRYA